MSDSESICFQLTLVRHGETEYNRQRIIQGQKDVELSEVGLNQAELVAKRLASEQFNLVFSSDLSRAKKTADAIVAGSKHKVEVVTDELLRERRFGVAEDRPLSALIASARRSKMSVIDYTPPGAETHQQVINRSKEFFAKLMRKCYFMSKAATPPTAMDGDLLLSNQGACSGHYRSPALHVLVATHGGWIHSFIEHLSEICANISLPQEALRVSPNTGVTSLLITISARQQSQQADAPAGDSGSRQGAAGEDQDIQCTAVTSLCLHDNSHL